jgi:mannose-6-phosphate isomerase-like protein (cupin superfamily)
MKIEKNDALQKLAAIETPFTTLFEYGLLTVEVYKPHKVDLQQPHSRDEVYIIISGTGAFLNNGQRTSFQPGDFLFVPAGNEHRFENFTDDFVTWVLFYGPKGGEKPKT